MVKQIFLLGALLLLYVPILCAGSKDEVISPFLDFHQSSGGTEAGFYDDYNSEIRLLEWDFVFDEATINQELNRLLEEAKNAK